MKYREERGVFRAFVSLLAAVTMVVAQTGSAGILPAKPSVPDTESTYHAPCHHQEGPSVSQHEQMKVPGASDAVPCRCGNGCLNGFCCNLCSAGGHLPVLLEFSYWYVGGFSGITIAFQPVSGEDVVLASPFRPPIRQLLS